MELRFESQGKVTAVAVLREAYKHALILGYEDGRIALVRPNGIVVFANQRHQSKVADMVAVHDRVVSIDASGNGLIWDCRMKDPAAPVVHIENTGRFRSPSRIMALSRDGETLFVADGETLRFHDGVTGELRSKSPRFSALVDAVAAHDKRHVVVKTKDQKVRYLSASGAVSGRRRNGIIAMCTTTWNTGEFLIICNGSKQLRAEDALDRPTGGYVALRSETCCLDESGDGSQVAIGHPDGQVSVVSNPLAPTIDSWKACDVSVRSIAMGRHRLAALSKKGQIKIWDLKTKTNSSIEDEVSDWVPTRIDLSSSDRHLAAANLTTVKVWSIGENQHHRLAREFPNELIRWIAFQPGTENLLIVRKGGAFLCEQENQKEVATGDIRLAVFSDDGKRLALGLETGQVILMLQKNGTFVEERKFRQTEGCHILFGLYQIRQSPLCGE